MQQTSYNKPEDIKHFQMFINGNQRGFDFIYKRLYKPVFRYGISILNDDFKINTILQDTFILVWERREKMESVLHIFRFIRLCVRWKSFAYFRSREAKCRRFNLSFDFYRNDSTSSCDPYEEIMREKKGLQEEFLDLIEKSIPYLPRNRRVFLQLYKLGYSPKKISRRLGISYQFVTSELSKSIRTLKILCERQKMADDAGKERRITWVSYYEIYLDKLQASIIRLYYEENNSFGMISRKLNVTPFQVMKQYNLSKRILDTLKEKEKNN